MIGSTAWVPLHTTSPPAGPHGCDELRPSGSTSARGDKRRPSVARTFVLDPSGKSSSTSRSARRRRRAPSRTRPPAAATTGCRARTGRWDRPERRLRGSSPRRTPRSLRRASRTGWSAAVPAASTAVPLRDQLPRYGRRSKSTRRPSSLATSRTEPLAQRRPGGRSTYASRSSSSASNPAAAAAVAATSAGAGRAAPPSPRDGPSSRRSSTGALRRGRTGRAPS